MLRALIGLLALSGLLLAAAPCLAAEQVEFAGRVVRIRESTLTLDADGAILELDVSEVDPRFLSSLRPGDDVRVTAFRLPDGSLLVYNVFYQPDTEEPLVEPPQGGTD
jgi:hypothetical protein